MKEIYLDNSATTSLDKDVLEAMLPYLTSAYGNADSLHYFGREAVKAVDFARDTIADVLHAKPTEIYFTSGATESDNWALKGTLSANTDKGNHALVSAIEHPALIHCSKDCISMGANVDFIPVHSDGIVDLDFIEKNISDKTVLVACMLANNEIGTIEPVKEVVKIAEKYGSYVLTDAVQAVGTLDVSVDKLGVDMLSLSAHKFHGPKGVGLLYMKGKVKSLPLVAGGNQERGKRGGTTNVAGVVGMAVALKKAVSEREINAKYLLELRNAFINRVLSEISDVKLNGDLTNRLANNADFTFSGINGEALLYNLDLQGVCASNGSACSSGTVEPSHVLSAIGLTDEQAKSSLRFTFGKYNTMEEVNDAVEILKSCVNRLRTL